ncbi:MAG: ABC transporter ATP-binding protein [Pseudomonadota bacterium]
MNDAVSPQLLRALDLNAPPTRPAPAPQPGGAPVLDVHVHEKRYGGRPVLQGVRLQVQAGEVVALVGASGCGKSTLLRIVAGLDADCDGRVRLLGRPVQGPAAEAGFVFQEPRLFPWLSVAGNVAFGASGAAARPDVRARGPAGAEPSGARALELLDQVGLAHLADAWPKQLSGGQAQRVALARACFGHPRLLLLDEPFCALDAFTRIKLQDLLLQLCRRNGASALLVTHDLDEAVRLADRVLVLASDPGRIAAELLVDLPHPRGDDDAAVVQARARVRRALQRAQPDVLPAPPLA